MPGKMLLPGVCVLAFAAAAAAQPAPESAADVPLIGDKAPPVDVSNWIKGEKVAGFEPGKVYVVEFWATWCGPCRISMPHISDLQDKYRDQGVRFIGVSDEEPEVVREFLGQSEWEQRTRYTLVADPDRSVHGDYLRPLNIRTIPTAFIVDKQGVVAWTGHPMQIDEPLARVVAGTWDVKAFERELLERREVEQLLSTGQLDKAIEAIDRNLAGPNASDELMMMKFMLLLLQQGRPSDAYAMQDQILASLDDAQALNAIAWTVLTHQAVKQRDLDFALKLAQRADELTKGQDASIVDTLARAHYEKGELNKAIELQRKAVDLADEDQAGELRETLEQYEAEAKGQG